MAQPHSFEMPGRPDSVAEMVAFPASDQASWAHARLCSSQRVLRNGGLV